MDHTLIEGIKRFEVTKPNLYFHTVKHNNYYHHIWTNTTCFGSFEPSSGIHTNRMHSLKIKEYQTKGNPE
jgi:hypothetical protein